MRWYEKNRSSSKMIDSYTLQQCKEDKEILRLKISNLEHAIKQSEEMISESKLEAAALTFLRRTIAYSMQDLEALYLLKHEHEKKKG